MTLLENIIDILGYVLLFAIMFGIGVGAERLLAAKDRWLNNRAWKATVKEIDEVERQELRSWARVEYDRVTRPWSWDFDK